MTLPVLFTLTALIIVIIILYKKNLHISKVNKELESFNKLSTALIDKNTDFAYLKDENLKYIFVNKTMKDFFDLPDGEIIGHKDSDLVDEEFAKLCRDADLKALERQESITVEDYWHNRYYKSIKFPIPMSIGRFGIGAYIRDITEEQEKSKVQNRMLKHGKLLLEVLSRSFHSKQEQLDYALHEMLKITESQYGYIYFYNEEKEEFVLNSWTKGVMKECNVKGEPKVYQLRNTGIWGEVVRQRKHIIMNDFIQPNPLKKGYPTGHVQLKRFMSVPVIIDDKIVAVVGFGNKKTDYNETDVNEISMLMSGVWNAVQRRESTEMLIYERNKYYQILLSIGDGVMLIDADKNVEVMNSVASKLIGMNKNEAAGKNYKEVFNLKREKIESIIEGPIESVFQTKKTQEIKDNAVLISKKGEEYHIEFIASPIFDNKGTIDGVVLVFRDVTKEKEHRKKIEYLSFRDSLTGLYNRRFFEEELKRLDTKRNLPLSVLMGDVNGLKLINDIFGHSFGDMLLIKVAETMQGVCREDDIIARWGGDEFVIILPKTNNKEAKRIAERIKERVSVQQIRAIKCSISMGFYTKSEAYEDIIRALDKAETKMYSEKTLQSYDVKKDELDLIVSFLTKSCEEQYRHALRVKEISLELGKALDLPKADMKRLSEAARLHDIGKVVLEGSLLKKRGPLSQAEIREIEQHPVIGYRILNYFDKTQELAEFVLAHHENWDGSGYPKGLKGADIPFITRIISAADAYDNIINEQSRLKPRNLNDSIRKIRELSGTKLDPYVSKIFIDLLRFKKFSFNKAFSN